MSPPGPKSERTVRGPDRVVRPTRWPTRNGCELGSPRQLRRLSRRGMIPGVGTGVIASPTGPLVRN